MPTPVFVALVLLLWIVVGTGAALHLGRSGFRSPQWYFLGAVLGPLFVPIALERAQRADPAVERTPGTGGATRDEDTVTVVVGVDGSAESDRGVRDAARILAGRAHRVVLVMAIDPDVVEFGDHAEQDRYRDLVAERAGWFADATPAVEVIGGRPGRVLLDVARQEQADVVVVGRRGRGLSHRLLGSVAEHVTRHSPVPVLLAGPPAGR